MGQNTTKTRTVFRPSRAVGLVLAVIVLAGCTSARQREEPTNLSGSLRFKNEDTFRYFHNVYRSGNLYQDFRPVMVVDAIYEDMQYRRLYVDMLKERFLIGDKEAARLSAQQRERFSNNMDFLVLVWGGTNDRLKLHKDDASWKVYLRDDDGELLTPSKLQPIKSKDLVYQFLKKYFTGLDRWSEVMRISFPKLDKAMLKQTPGEHPFQFIVTGVPGSVTMRWEDAGLFYYDREENAQRQ